jgi:hypothetical protein
MYSLYRKSLIGSKASYQFIEEASLFGCNKGYIPWLLRLQVPKGQGEPFEWHVDIETALARRDDVNGNALIIDLKPKDKADVFLCEIIEAWGHSDYGWTPMMLHLRGLIEDRNINSIDKKMFECQTDDVDAPIFSMLYLRGSVSDGKLVGPWTTPGPAINSVLLWPNVFEQFYTEAEKVIKHS